ISIPSLANHGHGHVVVQPLTHADRAGTGTTATMRRRKRLVQIHMDNIETHIPRTNLAKNGIKVGAVVIQQATGSMHNVRDLLNIALEYTQRGGIGEHDAGGLRPNRLSQCVHIDVTITTGGDLAYRTTTHYGGCR